MLQQLPSDWGPHESTLNPGGTPSHAVAGLWTFMWIVSTVVYVLVIAAMFYSLSRSRARGAQSDPDAEPRAKNIIALAGALTVVTLFVFLFYDFGVGRASSAPFSAHNPLRIDVVGHQWWWEVNYVDSAPSRRLSTANEIHIPIKRPIIFKLTSADVIHSFWIPNLNGKKDLIPGYNNDAWFEADTPGVYRGQCAEFCGLEHAKMAAIVVAQKPEEFAQWYEAQLKPAAQPTDSVRAEGQRVFLGSTCKMCHTIQGTDAGGRVGPDLTHFGSEQMLASGTMTNTPGNLRAWLADPQKFKPGTLMPATPLADRERAALVAYLEGLQ